MEFNRIKLTCLLFLLSSHTLTYTLTVCAISHKQNGTKKKYFHLFFSLFVLLRKCRTMFATLTNSLALPLILSIGQSKLCGKMTSPQRKRNHVSNRKRLKPIKNIRNNAFARFVLAGNFNINCSAVIGIQIMICVFLFSQPPPLHSRAVHR